MERLNPNFVNVALKILAGFAFILFLCIYFKSCDQSAKSPVQESIVVGPLPVTHFKDDSGREHAEVAAVTVTAVNTLDNHYQHVIDSLSNVIKTKSTTIQSALLISTETKGGFTPEITAPLINPSAKNDSSVLFFYEQNSAVNYHDKYLSIHGILNKDSSWKYIVTDSLSIVTYLKKKGWFGHQLYLDATAQNPNTSIRGITGIEITGYKPHKWGIGINVGYGFNGIAFSPIVSVGLQRSFIRF